MKNFFISLVTLICVTFSINSLAKKSRELSSESVEIDKLEFVNYDKEADLAELNLVLKNVGERRHYLVAVHTPAAKKTKMYRLDRDTEYKRSARRITIYQDPDEADYDLIIGPSDLTDDLEEKELLLIFADGSSMVTKLPKA